MRDKKLREALVKQGYLVSADNPEVGVEIKDFVHRLAEEHPQHAENALAIIAILEHLNIELEKDKQTGFYKIKPKVSP